MQAIFLKVDGLITAYKEYDYSDSMFVILMYISLRIILWADIYLVTRSRS